MNAIFGFSGSTMAATPVLIDWLPFFDPVSGQSLIASHLAVFKDAAEEMRPFVRLNEPVERKDLEADPVWRLREILDRLTGMAGLGANWDSYASQPPTPEARSKATDVIWDVVRNGFGTADLRAIPFAVVPLSGGGVQVEWRGSNNSIEVEIGANGSFGYLLTKGNQGGRQFEERDNVSEDEVKRQAIAAVS